MELKDLTKEQAIEIAKLVHGEPDWIKSEFEIQYYPEMFKDVMNGIYDDEMEMIVIFFNSITFGDKVEKIRILINSNLNISNNIIRKNPFDLISIGNSNQYRVIEKFMEWGLKPNY